MPKPAQDKPAAAHRSYQTYRSLAAGLEAPVQPVGSPPGEYQTRPPTPALLNHREFANLRQRFRFRISAHYLKKCRKAGAPLWKQVMPDKRELESHPEEVLDPLDETQLTPLPGLIHRYPSRVLWLVSSVCSSYCRYCTRKRIVSKASALSQPGRWDPIYEYIKKKPDIREVILSGGDPLRLGSGVLKTMIRRLAEIRTLKSIRIHTRELNFRPQRLTGALLDLPGLFRPLSLVHHFNHPAELDAAEKAGARRLQKAGFLQYNQSVLLAGVNDTPEVLAELSYRLLDFGIQPYYLHYLDKIEGSRHFALPLTDAHRLIKSLQGHLPGPAVPDLVVDGGSLGKLRISANQPIPADGVYRMETYAGHRVELT